jgi:hypothetical protein
MTKDQFDKEAEFHKTSEESVSRLLELKGDCQLSDLPLDSPYWDAQNVHTALYNKPKE